MSSEQCINMHCKCHLNVLKATLKSCLHIFYQKFGKKYVTCRPFTQIILCIVSTLDIVFKASCIWVTYMPFKKLCQIYLICDNLLNRWTHFVSFALEKSAKCAVVKGLRQKIEILKSLCFSLKQSRMAI